MRFRNDVFWKWEEKTHIPQAIMDMVNFIAQKIGYECEIEEQTIRVTNSFGVHVGYAKGFTICHCTSSYADGPSPDYSEAFKKWLIGLKFEVNNSYGDNSMDSATNWHDTFWFHDFIYIPTITYEEEFMEWSEDEEDCNEDYEATYVYGY